MLKTICGALAALGVLTAAGASAAQVTTNINFTTTGASPTTDTLYGSSQPCNINVTAPHSYEAMQVTVSTAGNYFVFDQSSGDGGFAIYNGPFDSANPATNCVASLDGSIAWTLAPGTYTLVGGQWNGAANGVYTIRFDGPAAITMGAPAPVPTMSEWAMILLGLMLAGGAALHLQRRRLAV